MEKYIENLFHHAGHIFELGFDEDGECTALAYSERLYKRTAYLKNQMEALGMQVSYDAGGNMTGLLPGKSPKKIMITSHLDSVVNAGRYDGVLGIVLPLEYVRWLKDNQLEPEHSIEIFICMGEESPGVTATFGSKLATGHYTLPDLQEMPLAYDKSTTVRNAIEHYFREFDQQPGFQFDEQALNNLQLKKEDYVAALEVHIEQFFLLKNLATKDHDNPYVGVMRGVGGHIRKNLYLQSSEKQTDNGKELSQNLKLIFKGTPSHSGATPMGEDYRDDALVKACAYILSIAESAFQDKIQFTNFEIKHPALTSVPYEVVVSLKTEEADAQEIKLLASQKDTDVRTETVDEDTEPVSNDLVYALARIGHNVNQTATYAQEHDEVRATITRLYFENPQKAQCFCDVRGATESGMDEVIENIEKLNLPQNVQLESDLISRKAPAIFPESVTSLVEEVLGNRFENRIMKGKISVPGQDIGIFSSYGIPASLLFIESGTGHHPDEYVREEAMEQAFEAVKTLLTYWDKHL